MRLSSLMAARPGRVFQEVTLNHDGPRDAAFRASPSFAATCRELSDLLLQASLVSGSDQLETA